MAIIRKIVERFVALPKKYQKIIIVAAIGIVILAVLVGTSGSKKLSGSYRDADYESHRYEFLCTSRVRNGYGGTLNEYYSGELSGVYSWYVIDDTVYIDGNPRFYYDGNVLYGFNPEDGVTVEDGNYLSGSTRKFDSKIEGGAMFVNLAGERIAYYYYDLYFGTERMKFVADGTYIVEGNIVYVCSEGGFLESTFYIAGDKLYSNVFLPI